MLLITTLMIPHNFSSKLVAHQTGLKVGNDGGLAPKDLVNYTIIDALIDPLELSPVDLYVSEGTIYSGSVYSLVDSSDSVVIGDENGVISVYLKFKRGGSGLLRWFFETSNPNVTISLKYFSSYFNAFVSVGSVATTGSLTTTNMSLGYDDDLLVNFRCQYSGGPFNLTMYWILFDPDPYERGIKFAITKSNLDIWATGTLHVDVHPSIIYFRNIPRNWKLVDSSPPINWDYKIMGFMCEESGDYHLTFKADNYWDYDDFKTVNIRLFDSNGDPIDLDTVEVYYTPVNLTTNTSYWYYNRTYRVVNPLVIDLYNISFTITLSNKDFDFFEIGGDPSEIEIMYHGMVLPHIVRGWDGQRLTIETTLPYLGANSSELIYMLYGGLKGKKFVPLDLGYYGTDFNNTEGLSDWIQLSGEWSVVSSNSEWYLFTNATNGINTAWFKYPYPQQVRYILDLKILQLPMRFNLVFRNDSQKNYFYSIYIDQTSSFVYAYVLLYKNTSGTLETLGSPQLQTYSKNIKDLVLELDISSQVTNLKLNNVNIYTYTFPDAYNYPIRLGIMVNGTLFYLNSFNVKNYYDYSPSSECESERRANVVEIKGEKRRLLGTISGLTLDAIYIEVYDKLGRLTVNQFLITNSDTNIYISTDLAKIRFMSSLTSVPVEIYAKDNNSYWNDVLLPSKTVTIYLQRNLTSLVGWRYSTADTYAEFNLTISGNIDLLITGDTLRDIITLTKNINHSIINNLTAKINQFETTTLYYLYGLGGNLTDINTTVININSSLIEVNATLHLIGTKVNTIVENLSAISSEIENLTLYLIDLNNTQINLSNQTDAILSIVEETKIKVNDTSLLLTIVEDELTNQSIILSYINDTVHSSNSKLLYIEDRIKDISKQINEINATVLSLNSTITFIDETLNNLVSELNSSLDNLKNYLDSLNKSVANLTSLSQEFSKNFNSLYSTLDETLNVTKSIYNTLSNFNKTIVSKLNLIIRIYNETLELKLIDEFTDLNLSIKRSISSMEGNLTLLLEDLKNELIERLQLRTIKLINEIDGSEVNDDTLSIKIGDFTVSSGSLILIASQPEFKVVDYWGREIPYNVSTSFEVVIKVKVGYLYLVNNRMEVIKVSIRPIEILDKKYEFFVRGLDYEMKALPLGDYLIEAYRLTGEKILESVVKLDQGILEKKEYQKVLVIKEQEKNAETLTTAPNLFLVAIPVVALIILGYLYRRSKSIRSLEFEEDQIEF